jgi:chitinase
MRFRETFFGPKRLVSLLAAAVWLFNLTARADLWCTAYYPGWEQNSMPASTIDFTAVTHIIHFSLVPNANGTLNTSANTITVAGSADLISRAHNAGKKVLICVGGANTSFQPATGSTNLSLFISNIVSFMSTRGYDGVDLDWEPLDPADTAQYTNLVNGLRTALNAITPRPLLTAAVALPPTQPTLIASLQNQFDQINLMTYDMAGPYEGWVTWFNAPIYDGGYRFSSTGNLIPSADGMVNNCITHGVVPGKLGIGIAFYGDVWTGGGGTSTGGPTLPRQTWTNPPTMTAFSYNNIMSTYYQTNLYHWDLSAQAAYLSITNANSSSNMFISYDDQRTCQAKVSYARNRGLGGVMIWELAQDHHANQADPLLQAIKQALATPGMTVLKRSGQDMSLSFTSIPLGSYRAQWTSSLTAGVWNTLAITNISNSGTGGVVQITDPGAVNQPRRFYRIKTPQ